MRLYQVPSRGGSADFVFRLNEVPQNIRYYSPYFLPRQFGARKLLFAFGPETSFEMAVIDLETSEELSLGQSGYACVYSPSGHILFQPSRFENGIWALSINEGMIPQGEAFPVASTGEFPSVSSEGTLVYLDRPQGLRYQLFWRDRSGEMQGSIGQPQQDILFIALSSNGKRVAVRGTEKDNREIWIHEVDRPIKSRFTDHLELDTTPVWSPGDDQIAFCSMRKGSEGIFLKPVPGNTEAITLAASSTPEWPTDWSRDGHYLLFDRMDPETHRDLWYFRVGNDGTFEEVPFLRTRFDEKLGQFSPDGRFVAYASNESGRCEVYVRPFPEGGIKWQISTEGGSQPRWSQTAGEIFYVQDGTLYTVGVTLEPSFSWSTPTKLFYSQGLNQTDFTHYDVAPEADRFVLAEPLGGELPTKIRVVQNWHTEFAEDLDK